MLETEPEKEKNHTLEVFLGFLLGILISIGCFLISIAAGILLTVRHAWLFPAFVAITLVGVGIVAVQHARESSYAVGIVITLSLALLLDAACAVAYYR
jgi:hypothetical protein